MEGSQKPTKVLPPNAFRELEPGETYSPVVPSDQSPPEVTLRSILIGVIMVVIFTFAAAYIGLKTGNVIETSIPVAILAVFLGTFFKRRNSLLENVIIQSLGQASGVVVAGAIFTIPALYVLDLKPSFLQIFLSCLVGGFLGVVLLVPLRRYFCKDLHGQLPFPEGTAITNVLATGEKSKGSAGKVLLMAFGAGFLYDLFVEFLHLWNHHLNSKILFGKFGRFMEESRFELRLNATAVYFGLGYIIGPRYAGIIAAGSVLSFLILVPLVYFAGSGLQTPLIPPEGVTALVRDMDAQQIFANYIRPMGIGCIAVAGMIGILKMSKIILSSLSLAFKGLVGKGDQGEVARTDRDMTPRNTFAIQAASVLGMLFLFWYISGALTTALVGTGITFALAFLFTPVAARAIAIVGVNPVSGMTMLTLIIACLALVATGLRGDALGMSVALVVGCAVCTALSTSGAFITDLKVGYWLGASPFQQQRWKFLGIFVASLSVGGVIWVLANSYGFMIPDASGQMVVNPALPAPQGNLMATIVEGVMGGQKQALILFALGGLVAVLLEMATVPALAFGLGMYLPIEINMAVFFGAAVGHFIGKSGNTEEEKEARKEQGTLIASGLMAGAAIIGTIGAILLLPQIGAPMEYIDFLHVSEQGAGSFAQWYEGFGGQLVSVFGLAALVLACYFLARKGAKWQLEEEKEQT
ncbi:MAG: oligopeptide transporter, OPT family [bacterium]|nr:oligopeptide transporter, OPT family [bacterium]